MSEHTAVLESTGVLKGETGYAFPDIKAAALFAQTSVRSPHVSHARVVDSAGTTVVEFLPTTKDTHTWGPSQVAKGYALTIS